jgi:hypothetical protein
MPLTFAEASRLFQADQIRLLAADADGLRFLILRSLNRNEYLQRLYVQAGIAAPDVGARDLFRHAYEDLRDQADIERCVRTLYEEGRAVRRQHEAELIDQLYRVQEFNWGGLHQNSLEKTIVDNYIKRITDFDQLNNAVDNELLTSLRGYVVCSWYNHWSSIIIEDIFKDHPSVLPAVGLVKKIDFFVRGTPFDLKVTYLPEGFVVQRRQEAGLRPELTLLKQAARRFAIPFTATLPGSQLLPDLWQKIEDHPDQHCQALIHDLRIFRNTLVDEAIARPERLIQWLYEQQGIRRFDASNRLFLVLIDQRNYFNSWRLKRAKALLEAGISDYLDAAGHLPGRAVRFRWEDGNDYEVISDLIVVRHNGAP